MSRIAALTMTTVLSACSLAPDFTLPEMPVPAVYKEQPAGEENNGEWKPAAPMEQADRGNWWKVFRDAALDDLEMQALEANPSLQAAAARVEQARGLAGSYTPSIIPNFDIGGNALRAKPSSAGVAAFGGNPAAELKPYTMYSAQGVLSYEADLFGRVRDNYSAYEHDADAAEAAYRSALLALQADVAQTYFSLRALDAERQMLKHTVIIREEGARIMEKRFNVGEAGEQDHSRAQGELASVRADLASVERRRAMLEHGLAVLLGKMPSEFTFAEAPLDAIPPEIPAGLPSSLLARRPDISAAVSVMAGANERIGVARTAFLPRVLLNASGGFESLTAGDLFQWSARTWTLGQLGGAAIAMPIFDSGRNLSRLDAAWAAYDEAVANYKNQVLLAFKDVEDNLADQRLLADQSRQLDMAAAATSRTTELAQKRYDEGETDYFEVVNTQRDSLTAGRAAVTARGQRLITTVALIRALGGGWDEALTPASPMEQAPTPEPAAPAAPLEPLIAPPAPEPAAPEAAAQPETPQAEDVPETQEPSLLPMGPVLD